MKIRVENKDGAGEAPVAVFVRVQATPLSNVYKVEGGGSLDLTLYEGAEVYFVSWVKTGEERGKDGTLRGVYSAPLPSAPWEANASYKHEPFTVPTRY